VLIEIDLGMKRVGVQTPGELVALASQVRDQPRLEFAGVAFYPGHIREHVSRQDDHVTRLAADLGSFLDALASAGLDARIVSGGSTPAAWRMHEVPGVTEVRPGTYVFNDRVTVEAGACAWDDCALTVVATVVSTSVPGQAVVDAGSKALGREPMHAGAAAGFAALLDRPDVRIMRMSEEHGVLDLSQTDWRPSVGDQVRLVPNHVCIVVNLNDVIYGVRDSNVETTWPVTARRR
jgi:D-serine deaminase-like pyridoxal phosphate-dependent protein